MSALRSTARRVALPALALLLAGPVQGQRSPAPRRSQVLADDGHALVVWSKRPAGQPRGSILLLHGRTWSSLPNFDLRVPGQQVSLMDALVARGYAVYALDQRGYGATARDTSGWLTPARAAADARAALGWVAAREHGTARPVLFGYSQGSMTAMLTAERDTLAMSALVLYGFPLDLEAARAMASSNAGQAERTRPERRPTTAAGAGEDFITPESTPAGVRDAYVRAATAADPVRTDWRGEAEFAGMDPARLRTPTLLINGERDPYASRANLGGFMRRLAGVDHSWVVLGRSDHAAHLERQREFVDAIVAFLEQGRPGRVR
jgi:pimeloyl-ACP methyl ester carboxylesterase